MEGDGPYISTWFGGSSAKDVQCAYDHKIWTYLDMEVSNLWGYTQIIHCVFGFSIVNRPLIGGTIISGNLHLVNPTSSIFLIKQSCELCRSIALHGQGARIESSPRGPSLYKSPKAISRDGSEWHQKGTCSVMILLFLI